MKDNLVTIRFTDAEFAHLEKLIAAQAITPTKSAAAHHFCLKGMDFTPAPKEEKTAKKAAPKK